MLGLSFDEDHYQEPEFKLWSDHALAMNVFSTVSDQWRTIVTPAGIIFQSIEMTSIASAMDMLGVEDKATVLRQVKLIQAGALDVLNK